METIKVKRSPESKGRCKLAWNKVYNAEINSFNKDSYIIGNNAYLSKWFTPVTDQQPKHKLIVKTDPETGKLKVERDWTKPQAFPRTYKIPIGTECINLEKDKWGDFTTPVNTKVKILGHFGETNLVPYFERLDGVHREGFIDEAENGYCDGCLCSYELAPLNPTDHPEHPEFGKAKNELKTIKTTPEPNDIRDTIAEYIRKYGYELTAIELIGHLTIDKQ